MFRRCVLFWNIAFYNVCCDTCDSKKAKTPVMRAYACARERGDCRYFHTSKKSTFDGWFVDCFLPLDVHRKQAVVFHKTTRCFHQNDTLFFIKRYVVFIKTSRRLKCYNALCWLSRLTLRCCKRSNDRLGIILPQKKVGTKRKWLCRSEFATQSLGW